MNNQLESRIARLEAATRDRLAVPSYGPDDLKQLTDYELDALEAIMIRLGRTFPEHDPLCMPEHGTLSDLVRLWRADHEAFFASIMELNDARQ